MSISLVSTRVCLALREAFADRAEPEDVLEFEVALTTMEVLAEGCTTCPTCECCGGEEHTHTVSAMLIYVAMACPEIGPATKVVGQVSVPLTDLGTLAEIAEVGDELWDRLQAGRMVTGAQLDFNFDPPLADEV